MGTRRRLAAGLCVLSVALLFGGFGGTVATADTETDGSVSDTQGLGDQKGDNVGTTQTEPVDTIPELLASVDNSRSDLGERHEESTGPMDLGVSAHVETANDETANDETVGAVGAAVVQEDNKGSDSVAATTAEVVNEPEVAVSHSPVTEPSPEPEATNVDVAAPTNDPPAEEPAAVEPVTNEVASVNDPAAAVQADAAPLVGGAAAPTTDVITALTYFFIALAHDSAQLVNIPGDLLSLLGFSPMGAGVTASLPPGGIGGSLMAGAVYSAASSQLAASQAAQAGWPGLLSAPGDSGAMASAGALVHPTPAGLGATGMAEQHSVGLKAVLADGILPESVRSFIQHTVDAVLAPLSLLALAALASPGVAGLWLLGAAGMFVGYRQARAASMLRGVGIARFVKAGPLGVVRSGGLVAVHARPSRAAGRQTSRARDLLEPVA